MATTDAELSLCEGFWPDLAGIDPDIPGRRELAELLRASDCRIRLTADARGAGPVDLGSSRRYASNLKTIARTKSSAFLLTAARSMPRASSANTCKKKTSPPSSTRRPRRSRPANRFTSRDAFIAGPTARLRWVELNGRLRPAWDGQPAQIIGTTADITARKHAEERERQAVAAALAATEASAKFRTFFEQGAGFAGLLSLDGTIIEVNRYSLDASGFSREDIDWEEVLGMPVVDSVPRSSCNESAMPSPRRSMASSSGRKRPTSSRMAVSGSSRCRSRL